jgi:hypothetical protein
MSDPIIKAYLNRNAPAELSDHALIEQYGDLIGSDEDLDCLLSEAIHRESAETVLVITEELTDKEKYDADKMERAAYGRSAYLSAFLSKHPAAQQAFYSSSEKNRRVRIPVTIKNSYEPHPDVAPHLSSHGWSVDKDSYSNGMATKSIQSFGDPEKGIPAGVKLVQKKIGSILNDTGAHPHIKKATPFGGGAETLIPENTVHGDMPDGTKKVMADAVGKLFPIDRNKVYRKNPHVYDDSNKPIHVSDGASIDKDAINTMWDSVGSAKADAPFRERIETLIQPGVAYKSTHLKKLSTIHKAGYDALDRGDMKGAFNALLEHDRTAKSKYGHIVKEDSAVNVLKNKIKDSFDPKNQDHIAAFKNVSWTNSSNNMLHGAVSELRHRITHAVVSTPDDVINHIHLINHIGTSRTKWDLFSIADKHKLGSNPIKSIAHELGNRGMLTKDNFQTVYHGLHGKTGLKNTSGNYYDHVVGLVNDGVHGADNLLNNTAKDLFVNGRDEYHAVRSLSMSRPETRRVIADQAGVDYAALVKKHKPALDREKKMLNDLIAAKKAKDVPAE